MTSDDDARQVLERRAAELAEQATEESETPTVEVVNVTVAGGRCYAVETSHVRQILRNDRLCRLPAEGGELVGLFLVKDGAVPVADLGSLLGLSEPDCSRPFVLLLDGKHPPLGLLVDGVQSSGRLSEAELRLRPGGPDEAPSFERGITADGVVLLDAEILLTDARLARPARAPGPATRSL